MSEPIRVFVGCGTEHLLAFDVLKFSIECRTQSDVEVVPLLEVEKTIPVPEPHKSRAPTAFSYQRFLIPEACEFEGKGIYLDSDQLVLHDIADLWNTPFPEGANVLTTGGWQSAVMLIDCESTHWQIDDLCRRMDAGEFTYNKLSNLRGKFANVNGALDPYWNTVDRKGAGVTYDPARTKLYHYTDMGTQPWLKAGHPHGVLWEDELAEALKQGVLRSRDVMQAIRNRHVRPSLSWIVGAEPPYPDHEFVFPDVVRRRKAKQNEAVIA